jgi:ketosteroid isomerase-like protein
MSVPKDFQAVTRHLGAAADAAPDGARSHNLATLQSQIAAIARGDFAGVLQDACEDVSLDIFVPPEFPFIRSAVGAGPFRRALETNFAAVAEQQPVIVDLFSEGDKVVMFGRETGVIKTTGRAYDLEFVQRFTFRDGRLAVVQIIAAYSRQTGR